MCGNLFKSPKVETPQVQQVAPAPQSVSQPERAAIKDMAKKNRRARLEANSEPGRTAGSSRVVDSLLNQAQSGTKNRLGD